MKAALILYQQLPDYQNFFQPVMKPKEKIREGAKLKRKDIPRKTEETLIARFKQLNPRKVLLEITKLAKR